MANRKKEVYKPKPMTEGKASSDIIMLVRQPHKIKGGYPNGYKQFSTYEMEL